MRKILLNFTLLFLVLFYFTLNNSYGASGDSVMSIPGISSTPTLHYQGTSASSGNIYSYTAVTQYQTAMCPSGLTVSSTGSTIYNSAQRIITTTYLGTQIVGTNIGSWTDIDTDCIGTQYQSIACPGGYNGAVNQSRKVGTSVGGYVYGDWVTYSDNCTPPYPAAGTVFYAGGWGVTGKGAADIWVQAIATGSGGYYILMTRGRSRDCLFDWANYNSTTAAYIVDNSGVGLGAKNGGIGGTC